MKNQGFVIFHWFENLSNIMEKGKKEVHEQVAIL